MQRKKNKFLTFLFSLIPGAGEMYMGFMKMGVSLMTEFFAVIWLASISQVSELLLLDVILWFYAFFHVHNIAGTSDALFAQIKDEYLIPFYEIDNEGRARTLRRFCAVVLIILGTVMLWNMFMEIIGSILYLPGVHYVPKVLIAAGLIVLGIVMIQGKKKEMEEPEVVIPENHRLTADGEEGGEEA